MTTGLLGTGRAMTPQTLNFEMVLARASSGDAASQLELAHRYHQPNAYPEWQGMRPNQVEAAKWCLIIEDRSPGRYADECRPILAALSPKTLSTARAMATAFETGETV